MRTFLSIFAAVVFLAMNIAHAADNSSLSLVVMDPLAAPLSCPCVEGYAQRKYEKLAEHLNLATGRKVQLTFAESLEKALKGKAKGRADIIIGKHSVVLHDVKSAGMKAVNVAALTGKDGSTTQNGLFVVPTADPAKKLSDLAGYRIIFGPADCQEKHAAALDSLRLASVELKGELETCAACSAGATRILELGNKVRAATVISSYAAPLLEGCGTIKKGDLRVVGETQPVPFVAAFVTNSVSIADRRLITNALLDVGTKPELCKSLESLVGFLPVVGDSPIDSAASKKND